MTLVQEAIRADQISDAFGKYRTPNPEHIQSITAAIAELAGLSWALREIDRLLEDFGYNLPLIEDDLKFVHDIIYITLADIWHIIGTITENHDAPLSPEDYRRNWRRIVKNCRERGKQDLSTQLDTYKRFLLALCQKLQSQSSSNDEFETLRRDIRDISGSVARNVIGAAAALPEPGAKVLASAGSNAIVTKRSYERKRDKSLPLSPTESEPTSPLFGNSMNDIPSPPMSPTNTYSTISQVSSGNGDREHSREHWALHVFTEAPSWTPLPNSSEKSQYHDVPGQPSVSQPSENYDEVVALGFPPDPPGLRVSLYCRRRDWRSKLVAQWKDRRGKSRKACLPMNVLEVYRIKSMLHFCRRLSDDHTSLAWLSLKFTSLERLILFACTFLSMRAQDGKKSVRPIDDWEFEGEESEYAGKIHENGYSHALRILRDETSRAIRLQASVRGGQLDNTPVWTAFITNYITSKTWCRRLDRNIVGLSELRPHSFSNDCDFQRLPNGMFVLNFETRDDAKEFVGCIEDLGRQHRRS